MQKTIFYSLLLFSCLSSNATPGKPFAKADSIARIIPADATKSSQSLAAYISKCVQSETERIKVIYVWMAYNIAYDINAITPAANKLGYVNDAQMTLNKRKGICGDYATLFSELATGVGIKSFVVAGLNIMPDGEYATAAHAWNVALIEGIWHLSDPTWGAGYVDWIKFEKRFSAKWFMPKPEDFIKTHMPFDPVWQLLPFPLTGSQFFKPVTPLQDSLNRFNFIDSIAAFEKQSEIERLLATAKRMRKEKLTGGTDGMPGTYILLRNRYYDLELMGGIYNAATNSYNTGVEKLNAYTSYYNRQFHPEKNHPEIQAMIDSPERYFKYTSWLLNKIEANDKTLIEGVSQLYIELAEVQQFINEQNAFLKLYYSTPAKKRANLFYTKRKIL